LLERTVEHKDNGIIIYVYNVDEVEVITLKKQKSDNGEM
jgi:hypothetical protein